MITYEFPCWERTSRCDRAAGGWQCEAHGELVAGHEPVGARSSYQSVTIGNITTTAQWDKGEPSFFETSVFSYAFLTRVKILQNLTSGYSTVYSIKFVGH